MEAGSMIWIATWLMIIGLFPPLSLIRVTSSCACKYEIWWLCRKFCSPPTMCWTKKSGGDEHPLMLWNYQYSPSREINVINVVQVSYFDCWNDKSRQSCPGSSVSWTDLRVRSSSIEANPRLGMLVKSGYRLGEGGEESHTRYCTRWVLFKVLVVGVKLRMKMRMVNLSEE